MKAPSHRQRGESDARTMLLLLSCFLATAAAAPGATTYNRRQEGGGLNVQADLRDILIVVGLPKNSSYISIFDHLLRNSRKGNAEIPAQDRSDIQVMEAFVEPQTPYQVDIGIERSAGGADGNAREAEVIIPARRRLDEEPQNHGDEMKLIGATEQCGPDRERDPVTLTCRFRVDAMPENTPEVATV